MSADIHIPDDYEYFGNDGRSYRGRAGYILNHLDSAEAGLDAELEKMKGGAPLREVQAAYALRDVLGHILARPAELARLL